MVSNDVTCNGVKKLGVNGSCILCKYYYFINILIIIKHQFLIIIIIIIIAAVKKLDDFCILNSTCARILRNTYCKENLCKCLPNYRILLFRCVQKRGRHTWIYIYTHWIKSVENFFSNLPNHDRRLNNIFKTQRVGLVAARSIIVRKR